MSTTNMRRNLELLLDGRIDFGAFARATRTEYERMAAYLTRRWVPPAWCSDEDIVQELLVGTWLRVWDFDQAWAKRKGVDLVKFAVYNAMAHAKRKLHKARGAKLSGTADKNPSRLERPFDPMPAQSEGGSSWDEHVVGLLREEPAAERDLIAAEERAAAVEEVLRACATPRERQVVMAIVRAGDVDGGGALLYDDFGTRADLRLDSERRAARYAATVAAEVVSRVTTTAS